MLVSKRKLRLRSPLLLRPTCPAALLGRDIGPSLFRRFWRLDSAAVAIVMRWSTQEHDCGRGRLLFIGDKRGLGNLLPRKVSERPEALRSIVQTFRQLLRWIGRRSWGK